MWHPTTEWEVPNEVEIIYNTQDERIQLVKVEMAFHCYLNLVCPCVFVWLLAHHVFLTSSPISSTIFDSSPFLRDSNYW